MQAENNTGEETLKPELKPVLPIEIFKKIPS